MLRLHLPPNLVAALARNAVPIRVELDLAAPPAPELMPALALLQRWCGPQPPAFLQLTRAQLGELADAADVAPVFVEAGRTGPWHHAALLASAAAASDAAQPNPGAAAAHPSGARVRAASPRTPLVVDGSEHFLAVMLPDREDSRYATGLALMKDHGFTLEPSNRKWWLRDRHKTLNFLAAHLTRLRDALGAEFTANFTRQTAHLRMSEIDAEVHADAGDFTVTLGLRADGASDTALRSAVATGRGYVEAEGKIVLVDPAALRQLTAAQRALAGDPAAPVAPRRTQRISSARVAEAQGILDAISPNFSAPEAWRERSAQFRELTALTPAPLSAASAAQLRPYQRLGVAWLWHLCQNRLGGILADEMGLGKTAQALALLAALKLKGESSMLKAPASANAAPDRFLNTQPSTLNFPPPSLVVCPASLLENWRREAARFAPTLRVLVHHGERRLAAAADFGGHDVVITSYGTLARDQELFAAVEFAAIVADEAQHIKNRRSQNAAALRALRAPSRFVLTGTPVENSLEDLRSLFEFLLPGYLTRPPPGLRSDERAWYDERLRAQTAPYILRRTKRAVAPELPAKIEQVVWCELTPAQSSLYRVTQERGERELIDLQAGGASETKLRFAALTQVLRLRQICCDPRLLPDALRLAPGEAAADSAKMEAISELIAEAIDDGHRVLVFSQFTSLLALLRTELERDQVAYCYLDGAMPPVSRQAEVDRFQSSPEIPLFLLSLKAGGTGLNLTGADTVVHFDPWWNPAVEAQATDRAHRIGQTRTVTSYKLIAAGTVEEKVLALQAEKRALLAEVFEASDAAAAKLSLDDLRALLR